jgi:hypothetical protein
LWNKRGSDFTPNADHNSDVTVLDFEATDEVTTTPNRRVVGRMVMISSVPSGFRLLVIMDVSRMLP